VPPQALIGQVIQKSYLKNEKELEHSENGCWRLMVAIYTRRPSLGFSLLVLK
jgi:hypothetical protein